MMRPSVILFWFRRDLRLKDNTGLYHALKLAQKLELKVLPIFIFDKMILDKLDDKADRRVDFIHQTIIELQNTLTEKGKCLWVHYGHPTEAFEALKKQYQIHSVFTNQDYEPYGIQRDAQITTDLAKDKIEFHAYKDQVIFEKSEVTKEDGKPYTVFTPYSRRWKAAWEANTPKLLPSEKGLEYFLDSKPLKIPSLKDMGFEQTDLVVPAKKWKESTVKNYTEHRNFPAKEGGTSHLGMHLRFGTISIRQLALETASINTTYLNELIWRDFYHMILWHFPHVAEGKSFRAQYDLIEWRNNEKEFEAWCNGQTGYPIVDAGMRELNATGFMHNRVRMIVASFLTKHLLIDWRWGEAYFAQKLLDFDFAANNGGWQWASGSGCDAAPYFRVFNPRLQTEKFDKQLQYIRKWIPELDSLTYPKPIVVHEEARVRVLAAYAKALKP
jgi:deoxyribodipyrimidine photo-lyase